MTVKPMHRPGSNSEGLAKVARALSPRLIGAVYLWIAIIIVFAVWAPAGFLQLDTATTILNQYAVSGIIALAAVVPLAAGVFDLSIGYTMGMAGAVVAWLLANTHLPVGVCVLLTPGSVCSSGCSTASSWSFSG